MTQYVINIGTIPNDGTGDPLRTAFNEVNLNFDQVFAAGPVLSNVRIANNTILTTNTNGNLILAPNGIGVVQANVNLVPNTSNIRNLGAADRRWSTLYIQYANISGSITVADLTATGNVTVGGNLSVTGNIINVANIITDAKTIQLANTAGTANAADGSGVTVGANDAIATFLFNSANNVWATNIGIAVGGPITGTSLAVSDATIYGNTNGIDANFTGTVTTPNIVVNNITSDDSTFVTIQDGLDVQGDITAETVSVTGNITANYFIGNGSLLTGVSNYANANAVAYGQVGWAGNIVPATSNTYSLGNSTLWWSNIWVAGNTIYIGGVPIGMSAGNVLTVNGNAVLQNASNTTISTTGNITADYFFGNGSQLTGLNTSSISNGTSNVDIATANGNITITAAGTDTWTFDTAGDLTVPNYIRFEGNTIIGDEPGAGTPYFRIDTPLGYPATITTDSDLSGNNWSWTFGADGNLTFPPNGQIVMDGGDATIGNQSDDFVISWDNEEIRLVSVQGSIEMQADAAFRVQTNYDGANALYASRWEFNQNEIVNITGNFGIVSEAGNLTLSGGRDGINSGNTIVSAVDVGNAVYNWTFGNNGALYLPNGGVIDADGTNIELRSPNSMNFEAVSDLNIYADNGNSQWTFGPGNTLTLPGGTAVIDSSDNNIELRGDNNINFEANNVVNVYTADGNYEFQFGDDGGFYVPNNGALVGVTANNNGYINWVGNSSGDGAGYTTMQLVPDATALGSDQYIILDPTAPGHIHIRAGGTQDLSGADLFLGGENSYFKVFNGANSEVSIASNSKVWLFGTDGDLDLAHDGNIVGRTSFNNGRQQWLGNSAGDGSGATTLRLIPDITLEGNEQYIIIDPTGGGDIHIRPGGNIDNSNGRLILGGENSAFVVESGPNPTLKIFSDENEWAFYGNAELAAPGAISAVGNITGSYIIGNGSQLTGLATSGISNGTSNINIATANGAVAVTANSSYTWNFNADGTAQVPTSAYGYAQFYTTSTANLYMGSATYPINIVGSNGDVLIPGAVSATGNITGSYIIGNGSQLTGLPAGYANSDVANFLAAFGSNSISTTGNVTANNISGNIQITGNVTGTTANVTLIAGSYSYVFDNTGNTAFANGTVSLTDLSATGNITGNTAGFAIGYRDIPQVSFSANSTAALTDAGKHFYSTTAGNIVLTIPDNANVAFPTGATLTIVVNAAGNVLVNQGTGVSLYQAGASATGNRVVGAYGLATVMKVATDTWVISGTGVY